MSAVRLEETFAAVRARPTVLVVEDEVLIRVMLAETLRQAGCAVMEAADAEEALAVLGAAQSPDVLITDVRMPGALDGLQLAARVRRSQPGLKVIVTSGHAGADLARGVADAFLPKPYALEQLLRRVETIVADA